MEIGRYYGIIFNIWPDWPVYHLTQAGHGFGWTACGREIGNHRPWLPLKHLEKFARPCRSCQAQEAKT